jgi:DNA polymerase III gamma/tau subunit
VRLEATAEEQKQLLHHGEAFHGSGVLRAMETIGEAVVEMRTAPDPRLVLEVAVVRLARREARTREETLLDRVERLERQLAGSATAPAPPSVAAAVAAAPPPEPGSKQSSGPMLTARAPAPKPATETAAAEPPAEAPSAPSAAVDLDEVILAWPAALEALKAPVRATVVQAQPIGVEDGVIVFGAPRSRFDAINARFRSEASAIKEALAARLGVQPRILVRPHDFDAADALRPVSSPEGPAVANSDEPPHESIDLDDLADASDAPVHDPAARLMEGLGAEVVEERARD